MAGEIDSSPWDYSRLAHEHLAEKALHQLVACGIAQLEQPGDGSRGADAFRITSWVDSEDAKLGHALAISQPYPNENDFIRGQFYLVDREYHKLIGVPRVISVDKNMPMEEGAFDQWIEELTYTFDREDFNLMLHMLGKAASAFNGEDETLDHDVMLSIAAIDEVLDELCVLSPGKDLSDHNTANTSKEHISEWQEFTSACERVLSREATGGPDFQEIALQYAEHTKRYLINLRSYLGQLAGVHILCHDRGAWQGQVIELDPDDDHDDFETDQVSPAWDRADILEALRGGARISHKLYKSYLDEAMSAVQGSGHIVYSNVVHLFKDRERPAA